jgi:trimeric autotransporter adhesin
MSVYTVSLRDTSNLGQVNIGDGTLLANLSVAAGRGPKGDGWTGVTYDENTGTFIFTSNDGLAYTSPDVRPEVDLDNVDINSGTIDGTVIGGSTAAAGSFTTGSFTGIDVTGTVTADGLTVQGDISATGGDVDLDTLDLNAIAASKAVTAVDVFVYDTSNDTDGGKWRKRTQGTSWYNETLNTATRGSRREFPSVAVIVAEDDTVTIYDGDDPALPMWMVFNATSVSSATADWWRGGRYATCVFALNGVVMWGTVDTGCPFVSFVADASGRYDTGVQGGLSGAVATAVGSTVDSGSLPEIVDDAINDVAMTVLPNAPIDAATGLPVPTIAVATNGGVSVIKDDGTVVDIYQTDQGAGTFAVEFEGDSVSFSTNNTTSKLYWRWTEKIPDTDVLLSALWYTQGTADEGYNTFPNSGNQGNTLYLGNAWDMRHVANANLAGSLGLIPLAKDKSNYLNSLFANVTSTYNTGWMNGDIKGAFLSDTDDTDLVGSGELVTNGTFDTVTTGWTAIANTTLTIDTGRLKVTSDANALGGAYQAITTVVGQRYLLTFTGLESTSTSSNGRVYVGTSLGGAQLGIAYAVGDNEITFEFTATTTTTYLQLNQHTATAGLYMLFDDVSVVAADADRSVNANPLKINGTITKTPVATGADLVAYSGFSASNYLEQPYNSDLDFGTGDFCVMGWGRTNINGTFLSRGDGVSAGSWFWRHAGGSTSPFYIHDGSAFRLGLNVALPQGDFVHFALLRKSGVIYLYGNGALIGSLSGTYPALSMSNATAKLRIGELQHSSYVNASSKLALLRISATAPSAEQIAKIYNDEKALFQENAQATLYGSSDAVTALAHDDATDLLHVGTSAGRSVFQGLRRVENTTTAVGTAISAANNMIVEE